MAGGEVGTAAAAPTVGSRDVPRTDTVLADPLIAAAVGRLGRERVRAAVRTAQQGVRTGSVAPRTDAVVAAAIATLPRRASSLTPVLNASGAILHTNLGRAEIGRAHV